MRNSKFIFIGNKKRNEQYLNAVAQYRKITDHIDEIKHELCYFPAVDVADFVSTEVYKHAELPTFLTPEEIGRALTHIYIFKKLLESDLEYIYVLEANCLVDEKYFSSKFYLDVERFFKASKRATIVLLQESCNSQYTGIELGDCKLLKPRECYGTCGYIINRQAAENILKLQESLKFEIDIYKYYYWLQVADIYMLDKNVVVSSGHEEIYGKYHLLDDVKVYTIEKQLRYRKYKLEFRKLDVKGKCKATIRRFF